MSATHTDLVIQLSTTGPAMDTPGVETGREGPLVAELRRCLQPGVEIALVVRGYMAITSILWLSGPLPDHSLRAGVRLLGVSVLPAEECEATQRADSRRRTVAGHLDSPALTQFSS